MILPVYLYGSPVLREKAQNLPKDYPGLEKLLADMFETMYNASGVGLAAPQVGKAIRLFIVDGSPMDESEEGGEDTRDFKKVFINPVILEETGEEWAFEEGCLSIPAIREEVWRPETLTIRYLDENWQEKTESYSGIKARIIQHEYDHIEGVLFTDYVTGLRKQLLRGKLNKILKGLSSASYPTRMQPKK
ncbi:MAG: peptide deformylase [Bacteroidia bacterium]|nr:peptide deformylase [Bacteroidia bacterium]